MATVREAEVLEKLRQVARRFPVELHDGMLADCERVAFNIMIAIGDRDPSDVAMCDIGSGVGFLAATCKALGFKRAVIVDDFGEALWKDFERRSQSTPLFAPLVEFGVEVVSRDAVKEGLGVSGPLDIVTTFDSMEHWHHSPKRLFAEVMRELKPGGRFVLGVPNNVNLRKRLTAPFGRLSWSSMHDWYEQPEFRGHVREPNIGDLRYIARDMGLTDVSVQGANWTGLSVGQPRAVQRISRLIDRPLRRFPSLCGDIYLVGEKP